MHCSSKHQWLTCPPPPLLASLAFFLQAFTHLLTLASKEAAQARTALQKNALPRCCPRRWESKHDPIWEWTCHCPPLTLSSSRQSVAARMAH